MSVAQVACSRLKDSGEKYSFSKKKCEKRAGAGEKQGGPFPSRARLIFASLVLLISPHYTIWEPGTGYRSGEEKNGRPGNEIGWRPELFNPRLHHTAHNK